MNPFPSHPRGLHGQLVHWLGSRIIRSELKPGDPLTNETSFNVDFPVSRTAFREALRVLTAKGLVESRQKVGTRVCPRSRWNLLDPDLLAWRNNSDKPDHHLLNHLIEVRNIIEPGVAGLAAARATVEEIGQLETAYQQMQKSLDANDETALIAADVQFHDVILLASHNELLQQINATINTALTAVRKITIQRVGAAKAAMPLHAAVVKAIRARKPSEAAVAMRKLIQRTAHDVDAVLKTKRK